MRDENRDAIRDVLKQIVFPIMLVTDTGYTLCASCVRDKIHQIISDLRKGVLTDLTTVCLAQTDGRIICECCNVEYDEYEDEDYYHGDNYVKGEM